VIKNALLLAAGQGSRLRKAAVDIHKPLFVVGGKTLIGRAVAGLASAGIERVVVVVGFRRDELVPLVERDADVVGAGAAIEFTVNHDWARSFGASVLAGRGCFTEPFLLAMSDHVCDPAMFHRAARVDLGDDDLVLFVDRRIGEVFDLPDCTKVQTRDGRIVAIGKQLTTFDAIDTGVFAIRPQFLDLLAEVYAAKPDASLSDAVQRLSREGRARVETIGDVFWQDVDTPEALERAENVLGGRWAHEP
jgi:1L-myo-inositol 1-phosphate cytidylyltransferase